MGQTTETFTIRAYDSSINEFKNVIFDTLDDDRFYISSVHHPDIFKSYTEVEKAITYLNKLKPSINKFTVIKRTIEAIEITFNNQ